MPERTDKEWADNWRRVGPILEEIRRQELRNYKYEEHYAAIDGLLDLGYHFRRPRLTSGLVVPLGKPRLRTYRIRLFIWVGAS